MDGLMAPASNVGSSAIDWRKEKASAETGYSSVSYEAKTLAGIREDAVFPEGSVQHPGREQKYSLKYEHSLPDAFLRRRPDRVPSPVPHP